jgi:hypothetical protein
MTTLITVPIDIDALHTAYTEAHSAHPDTSKGWGRAIVFAYEGLCDLWADGGAVQFDGVVLLVESATEPGTIHRANGGCDCMAGERAAARGETAVCWHRAQRQLICRMLELAARRVDLGARRERAYSEMEELYS